MRKLIEPLLYLLGFALAIKLIFQLKYAPMVLFIVVADDIPIGERLLFIGLILVWILLAFIAVMTIKNATRIGVKFMNMKNKKRKDN